MRFTLSTRTIRSLEPTRLLTGWRYAAVVTVGSVVLLAGLIVLGVGVAAKMGVGVAATPQPEPAQAVAVAAPEAPTTNDSTPAAPAVQTPEATEAAATTQPATAAASPSQVSSVCDALATQYRALLDDLAKTKPIPVVNSLTGAVTGLLKGKYNASANAFNASLDADLASYTKAVAANACTFASSPFDALTKAQLL